MNNYTDEEIREIAIQLRCPDGEMGDEIAKAMEDTNSSMIIQTLTQMKTHKDDILLELGPGNGFHLKKVLDHCQKVYAIDISNLMVEKIKENYEQDIVKEKLMIQKGDGIKIALPAEIIDKAFTVNTVYFWENPEEYLNEIAKTLKPGGEFYITYAHRRFMETLPFAQYGFKFYDEETMNNITARGPFTVSSQKSYKENVVSKLGDILEREFVIAKLVKMR